MQAEVFHIYHRGEQRGPYTMKQVNHLYRSGFLDDDAMYWREGLEQWHPITEIVARRKKKKRLKVWLALLMVVGALSVFVWLFGHPTLNAWRELTSGEYTEQSAWWRARGLVREGIEEHVDFEPFSNAVVKLHGDHEATVTLAGYLRESNGTSERRAWRVRMHYDPLRSDWEPLNDSPK